MKKKKKKVILQKEDCVSHIITQQSIDFQLEHF